MKAIFLSASVPVKGRGNYYLTAKPELIELAVRELVCAVIRERILVWGGHPAITPMVWAICDSLNVEYSQSVILYQSNFFQDRFPEETSHFKNVVFVDAVKDDLETSLLNMRTQMLSRDDLEAAVFIGGMDGVEKEFDIFSQYHPKGKVLPVPATGGAALELARRLRTPKDRLDDVDFAGLFQSQLLPPSAGRPLHRPKR